MQQAQADINVLHVIDKLSMEGDHPSSCTRLLAGWAAAHDPRHVQLAVCSLQRDAGGRYLEERGLEVHHLDHGKISPALTGAIAALAGRLGANLLHLHGYSASNFGRLAGRRLGIPTVIQEHGILRVRPHQFLADLVLRSRTDRAVAISHAVREFMVRGRCIPRRRIEVIHNGIPLARYGRVEAARVEAMRRRLELPPAATVVGSVTRLRAEKGTRFLVEAAARVCRDHPGTIFLVIGDGPERAQLERQAARLGLGAGALRLAGFLEDVPAALALMDVAVVASVREGLSLAVLEAMAAGIPLVATRVGGILDLVAGEVTALLVPPGDAAALAAGITRLLVDTELAAILAQRARRRSECFSIERNVRGLERLYASLVPPRGTQPALTYRRAA